MSVIMHPGWSARVEIVVTGGHDVAQIIDDLVAQSQADHGGHDGLRAQLTFTIDAATLPAATSAALSRVPELPPGWSLAAMHVVRYDLIDAAGGDPQVPDLVGLEEAAAILDISRQRVRALIRTADFPLPVFEFEGGPVYLASDIYRFAATPRHPGRPLDDPEFRYPVDPDLR